MKYLCLNRHAEDFYIGYIYLNIRSSEISFSHYCSSSQNTKTLDRVDQLAEEYN